MLTERVITSDNVFAATYARHEKNYAMEEAHYHLSHEIMLIESGKTTVFIDDRLYTLERGDVLLIKSGNPHINNGGWAHSRFSVNFSDEYMSEFVTDRGMAPLMRCFGREKLSLTATAFGNALEIVKHIIDGENPYAYVVTLLSLLCDDSCIRPTINDTSDDRISEILAYIKGHCDSMTGLDELAEYMHMSKSNLCRLVKKASGITVSEYVHGVRINRACRLLRETDFNISETAARCGYDSASYFTKVFRKIVHMTPMEFKKLSPHE